MRYYSDKTKKFYTVEQDLHEAEAVFDEVQEKREMEKQAKAEQAKKLQEERAVRAKAVEDAFAKAAEAEKNAEQVLKDFCKDYGAYHTSFKGDTVFPFHSLISDLFF